MATRRGSSSWSHRVDQSSLTGNIDVMPKASEAIAALPPAVVNALKKLGENLAIARSRRRESQRVWAKRLGVSVPTLIRMERGDPGVRVGIFVTALWMIGRADALPAIAAPENDRGALELVVREALSRRARRRRADE